MPCVVAVAMQHDAKSKVRCQKAAVLRFVIVLVLASDAFLVA